MTERKTLLQPDQSKTAAARGAPLKLVGAALLLVGAVGVLGWGLGLFGGGPKANTSGQAELNRRFEEQAEQEERQSREAPIPRTNAGG